MTIVRVRYENGKEAQCQMTWGNEERNQNVLRERFGYGWEIVSIDGVDVQAEVNGEQVLESFFKKWEADTVAWFAEKIEQYREMSYKEWMDVVRPHISKSAFLIITNSNMDYVKEVVGKDMISKKESLLKKIGKAVGEITELDLTSGADGTPNGYVTGTAGKVSIETIVAGGYNIQCAHYRVLVKKVK